MRVQGALAPWPCLFLSCQEARLARLVASFLGIGFLPRAPGTAGSIAALFPGLLLLWASPAALAAGVVVVTLAGLWAVRAAGAEDDPGWVVIDEVAGQWIALLGMAHPTVQGALVALVAFRTFDIAKPGPVGWAERLPGAAGVMADDVVAGAFAAAVVLALRWVAPGLLN
jgi:phosphatidylglycerophosphatase A